MGAGTAGTAKAIAGAAGAAAFGPLGALAGPIIGGLFGRSGQDSANQANLQIARENREFQERMSNTAYQRSAADLSKAGLNRILALGQPATTPAGNIATMQNKNALLASGITSGVQAGLTAKRLQAEIRNINARTILTGAQTEIIKPATVLGGTAGDILQGGKEILQKGATSAKEAIRRKIQVDIGTPRTWNEVGLKAAEAYAKEFPNATKAELEKIYNAAVKRAKQGQKR